MRGVYIRNRGALHTSGRALSATLQRQAQRLSQPGEAEEHDVTRLPDPGLSVAEIAGQLAADPEFAEAFGRERRNPFR